MSARTTLILLIAILITIVSMQNTHLIHLKIMFWEVSFPAAYFLIAAAILGFLLSVLLIRPARKIYPSNNQQIDDNNVYPKQTPDTLSKEDRDYIS